ncbi:hypothetical protein EKD04_018100 [Chloroflexales bacterium ZM16-3]|nr:hypothetical protein [Chloroflexales bacterium ZM16-3]
MNLNLNQKQTRVAGIALITIGVVAIFHLWWAIPSVLLAAGGVTIYRRQRAIGRTGEAVQGALWGVGLALLLLIDFVVPGVLLLGGASLLLRGRELEADQRVQRMLSNVASRRRAAPAQPAQPVAQQPKVTIVNEQPTTGETVRLH